MLKNESTTRYNIGYADKNDTIFYISNGLIPIGIKVTIGRMLFQVIQEKLYGLKTTKLRTFRKYYSLNQATFIMQIIHPLNLQETKIIL